MPMRLSLPPADSGVTVVSSTTCVHIVWVVPGAPAGVADVSSGTFPGWQLREFLRTASADFTARRMPIDRAAL